MSIEQEKHFEIYKNVLNKLSVKSLQLKYKNDRDKNVIINHIYDTYYNECKFNIEDIIIIQEIKEPNCYMVYIDNDNLSVQYFIQTASYGQQLNTIIDEHFKEHISYFETNSIWKYLRNYNLPSTDTEPSNFEDTDTKCPICLDDYCKEKLSDKLYNCGHKYCVDCIDQVIEYATCSICRETTVINKELTIDDIEYWQSEENKEKLIQLLIDAGEYDNFKDYCINSDGYTHLLGYDSGTDFTDDDGTDKILMCVINGELTIKRQNNY